VIKLPFIVDACARGILALAVSGSSTAASFKNRNRVRD
jgi:hypothetical protein